MERVKGNQEIDRMAIIFETDTIIIREGKIIRIFLFDLISYFEN